MAEKEYIEREKINDYISKLREYVSASVGLSQAEYSFISDILTALENFTAADVAPVVHCKDCVFRGREDCAMYYRCNCGEQHTWETDNDFCSYGERKDGGEGE